MSYEVFNISQLTTILSKDLIFEEFPSVKVQQKSNYITQNGQQKGKIIWTDHQRYSNRRN